MCHNWVRYDKSTHNYQKNKARFIERKFNVACFHRFGITANISTIIVTLEGQKKLGRSEREEES